MIHDAAQKDDTSGGDWRDVDLFLILVAHALVKNPELSTVALLPVRVEVYDSLHK